MSMMSSQEVLKMSPNEPKVLYLNIVGTCIVFAARSVLRPVLVHVLDAVFFFNLPANFVHL